MASIEIPYQKLAPATLEAVLEEYVTRDGTDDRDAAHKIRQVMAQLEKGEAVIVFDDESGTCHVVRT
ncbi:MAG: YheU family protein [Planctomycetes bacterium]|nr:YheU family protein [Planctomycetota bacterium]